MKLKKYFTVTRCFLRIAILTLTAIGLTNCLARPVVVKHEGPQHEAWNKEVYAAIMETAKTGDWLIIRGYHATDMLVAHATGIPLSHVAVFNRNTRTVVEAEGKGVHTTTLSYFVDKSYRILIIRPRWRTKENAESAWKTASQLVGENYDFLGTIGFDFPESYYCSELVITIYEPWFNGDEEFPSVIKPGELFLYGTILYDSGPRSLTDPETE